MIRTALFAAFAALLLNTPAALAASAGIVYPGGEGPGKGRHIVLIAADNEYRSEQGLPQLGRILSERHGFKCTVLFSVNPETGEIDPDAHETVPGLEALKTADLMIPLMRFRNLPDSDMQHFVDYVERGGPILAMRTSTHAFNIPDGRKWSAWTWTSEQWPGGFGRQILGETWISHHGHHGVQSTRGVIARGQQNHPIVNGIEPGSIWGPSDVYGVTLPLPDDSRPIILGQILTGMKPNDPALEGKKNVPMMPVAWLKTYTAPQSGIKGMAFTTTMGAAQDLESEGLRRLLVNAAYYLQGMEVPNQADVRIIGEYNARPFGFGNWIRGEKPSDYAVE